LSKPARSVEPTNPWGLTELECKAMDARVTYGSVKKAEIFSRLSARTIENALARVRERMGVGPVLALAAWVEFRKEQKVYVRTPSRSVQLCACCQGLGFVPKVAT
jgi:hypothetical protein